MAKTARKPEEILKIKKHILDTALKLIVKEGYGAFSMRKLAAKLGISATAIYRYYESKEILYLNVLIEGFGELAGKLEAAYNVASAPADKLRNIARAYIEFGIKKANLYNIMLIWNVPKYYDFVGTPAESVAKKELETALSVQEIALKGMTDAGFFQDLGEKEMLAAALEIICAIHGFISFYNSRVMDYLAGAGKDIVPEQAVEDFLDALSHRFFEVG